MLVGAGRALFEVSGRNTFPGSRRDGRKQSYGEFYEGEPGHMGCCSSPAGWCMRLMLGQLTPGRVETLAFLADEAPVVTAGHSNEQPVGSPGADVDMWNRRHQTKVLYLGSENSRSRLNICKCKITCPLSFGEICWWK